VLPTCRTETHPTYSFSQINIQKCFVFDRRRCHRGLWESKQLSVLAGLRLNPFRSELSTLLSCTCKRAMKLSPNSPQAPSYAPSFKYFRPRGFTSQYGGHLPRAGHSPQSQTFSPRPRMRGTNNSSSVRGFYLGFQARFLSPWSTSSHRGRHFHSCFEPPPQPKQQACPLLDEDINRGLIVS
jgi:hypothetical protein